MELLMDLHTHTIASGHAFSTLKENIVQAKERGLKVLGISDHSKGMPGASGPIYFGNFKVIKEEIMGVRILKGIEANIVDYDGTIDADVELRYLDYVIASIHSPCFTCGSEAENTKAVIGAMKNPAVRIIGHPDDGNFPINCDEVAEAAAGLNVFLELNNSSLFDISVRKNGRENARRLLEACKKHGALVVAGSDSHIYYDVGNFQEAARLLAEVDFPEELVLNARLENLELLLKSS